MNDTEERLKLWMQAREICKGNGDLVGFNQCEHEISIALKPQEPKYMATCPRTDIDEAIDEEKRKFDATLRAMVRADRESAPDVNGEAFSALFLLASAFGLGVVFSVGVGLITWAVSL